MVVPVAKALQDAGMAQVQVLGLTTAAPVVRDAHLPLLQFKDFVSSGDGAALAQGRELLSTMGSVDDPAETEAYLGLCYAELEADLGPEQARLRYEKLG